MEKKKSVFFYLHITNRQLAIFAIMLLFNFAAFSQAGQKWSTSGNEVSSNEFIGTTNKVPLIFRIDNAEKLRIIYNSNVGEMNTILLKKIEELTLYTIEQHKRIEKFEGEIVNLKSK